MHCIRYRIVIDQIRYSTCTLFTYPAAFTQVMGNAHCRTNIHNDWYKPEGINMKKLTNLTVTCAKRQHTLPECTKHTSPCLFNIKEDPCEFNNIAKQHPELVNRMVKRLHQFAVKKWVDQLVFSTRIFCEQSKNYSYWICKVEKNTVIAVG